MQEMATIKAWSDDNDQLHQEKQEENVWATILHHRMMMPNQQMHCLVCCKRFCLKALLQVNERVKPVLRRAVRVSKAVRRCEILKMRGVEVAASSSTVVFCCWEVEGILFLSLLFQVQGIQCEGVVLMSSGGVRKMRRRKWGANEHGPKKQQQQLKKPWKPRKPCSNFQCDRPRHNCDTQLTSSRDR